MDLRTGRNSQYVALRALGLMNGGDAGKWQVAVCCTLEDPLDTLSGSGLAL